ncbi:MAG: hypothetical protein FJY76_03715 [Candidatus Aenigmarchaeota archaeon]|nr:hypothetical protein [Candidatus Aenigmarchaeota archaeon]
MIWFVIWPWLEYSVFDTCWADFASNTGKLVTGIYEYGYRNVTIEFGTCITGLYFVNKGEMNDLRTIADSLQQKFKELREGADIPVRELMFEECDDDKEGFILAVPWFGELPQLGGPMVWIVGGALVGAWTTGKVPALSKVSIPVTIGSTVRRIPVLQLLGAITGAWGGEGARDLAKRYFGWVEARVKGGGKCYSLGMPFDRGFEMFPELSNEEYNNLKTGTKKYEPYKGKYCILLFKGSKNYYARGMKGACDEEKVSTWVDGQLKEIRNLDKGG